VPEYNPAVDGRPEPGEVVWAWVPFEAEGRQGKERPVLVLSVDGLRLRAVAMSTRTDDRDRRRREVWEDIGTGDWDRRARPSVVRVDQVLVVSVYDARRVGAYVEDRVLEAIRASVRRHSS
jgi:mRNA-degrading endonuclease toxin of MazEF toxin-antitoxin module